MTFETPDHTVTIKEVAARADVSPGTVSNVLNRPERVAAPTRDRVHAAIRETGYVRNAAASRLRSLDNRAIGILVNDVSNFVHSAIVKGAQHAVEAGGFMAMLCDGDRDVPRTMQQIDFLEAQRVAGVLATGSTIPGVGERLEVLRRRGVALVLVDAQSADPEECSVALDDARGGVIVGEHLLSLGRRRITVVTTELTFKPFDDRVAGIQQAVAASSHASDVEVDVVSIPAKDFENGRPAADAVVANRSDALFCVNDHIAFGAMRELLARGVRIPDDVALIGYDNSEFCTVSAVRLSSVHQPAQLVGETAARLLIQECSGEEHAHEHVLFQPELIARESTLGSTATTVTTS